MDFRLILWAILLANILQIPQVQKAISWSWGYIKFKHKRGKRFVAKWARRFYYFVKGLFNG